MLHPIDKVSGRSRVCLVPCDGQSAGHIAFRREPCDLEFQPPRLQRDVSVISDKEATATSTEAPGSTSMARLPRSPNLPRRPSEPA